MTVKETFEEKFGYVDEESVELMQEYAKLKCKELLEIVVEKAKASIHFTPGQVARAIVDKDSILNAVDLETFCS